MIERKLGLVLAFGLGTVTNVERRLVGFDVDLFDRFVS